MNETRNYSIEGIKQNSLMDEKRKKVYTFFNSIEHLLILVSAVSGCVSISAFASLLVFL